MTGEKTSEHPMEGPVWGVMISLNLKGKESLASLLHDRRNVVPHCEIILVRDGKNYKGGDTLHTGEGRENGATPAAGARGGANSSWVLETCPGEKVLNLEGNGRVILRGDQQEDIVCILYKDSAREGRTPIWGTNDEGPMAEPCIILPEMGQADEVIPWNLVGWKRAQ